VGNGPFGNSPFLPRPPGSTIATGGLFGLGDVARQRDPRLSALSELLSRIPRRREIFVSYHHAGDQRYYDALAKACDDCTFLTDRSVDRLIGSDDVEYQERRIREKYINGTSATVVLCGAETFKRKFVDWEIHATLDKQHGLIGICLPTAPLLPGNKRQVPDRYMDNWLSGFAVWHHWHEVNAANLRAWTEEAVAKDKGLIRNTRDKMTRNAS
jgi:hypothetical protein